MTARPRSGRHHRISKAADDGAEVFVRAEVSDELRPSAAVLAVVLLTGGTAALLARARVRRRP